MTERPLHPATQAIRIRMEPTAAREHSAPLYLTSSFTFDSAEHARALFADEVTGNVYSRYSNPNTDEFVARLCALEGAEDGIATASGMAAVFASLGGLLSAGDHVLASRALFGSTHQLFTRILPRWGIEATYVDGPASIEEWERAVRPATRAIFVETPSNSGLDLVDLAALGELCGRHEIHLIVDNCFATPLLQQPTRLGADLVVHSATKFIDGQGRTLGGAVLGRASVIEEIRYFARHTGPSLSPFNAWVLSRSLETLDVRMSRHCDNALALALALQDHPALEQVRYPYLRSHPQHELAKRQMSAGGGIVVLVLRDGLEGAQRFLDSLRLLSHSPNLGDARTIVTHPTSTTHSKMTEEERERVGILPGLIRISVGLEHVDDIVNDVMQALERPR